MVAHDHDHGQGTGAAFAWAIVLNAGFVVIEAIYGVLANSLSLLADAGHNLTDVLGLMIAWGAFALSRRKPTQRHTYGLGRATILAALFNAVAILIGVGALVWEAVQRMTSPVAVLPDTVMAVAAFGIAVNGGTALLFFKGRRRDINVGGVFLHMLADTAVSVGVIAAAAVIWFTQWTIVDPIAAILVSVLIGWSAFSLLKSAIHLNLDGVPASIDIGIVREWLINLPNVTGLHDLHIWPLSTTSNALTVHLVMAQDAHDDDFLHRLSMELDKRFDIDHATVQIEHQSDNGCRLAPDDRP